MVGLGDGLIPVCIATLVFIERPGQRAFMRLREFAAFVRLRAGSESIDECIVAEQQLVAGSFQWSGNPFPLGEKSLIRLSGDASAPSELTKQPIRVEPRRGGGEAQHRGTTAHGRSYGSRTIPARTGFRTT